MLMGPMLELYLVLFSRLHNLVLSFHCPNTSEDHTDSPSVPDPFMLEIPLTFDPTSGNTLISRTNRFSSLCFKEITYSPSSVGKKHYDPAAKLIKLFLLDSHLSVREIIYTRNFGDGVADEPPPEKDILRLRRRYPELPKASTKQSLDGFIVDDWDESVFGVGASALSDKKLSRRPAALPQWVLDYSHVYAITIGSLILSKEGEGVNNQGKCLQDLIRCLDVNTPGTAPKNPVSHTL